jgi:hypothetical protein
VLLRPLRAPGGGGLTRPRVLAATLLAVLAIAPACQARRRADRAADVVVTSSLTPTAPSVGPATLALRLADARGPVGGARLRVEADMTHPGMRPVVAEAHERGGGLYEARLAFTMGGDWMILVSGELADGRRVDHRVDVPGVRAAP